VHSELRRVTERLTAALLLPALALLAAWALGFWSAPVFDASRSADQARVGTLPGRDSLWWLDDEQTYFLLPPIRRQIIREKRLDARLSRDGKSGLPDSDQLRNELGDEVLEASTDESSRHPGTLSARYSRWQAATDALNPEANAHQLFQHRLRACLTTYPASDDAGQMHLRALLLHKLAVSGAVPSQPVEAAGNDAPPSYAEQAKEAYHEALKSYAWYEPEMAALCCADFARLLAAQGSAEDAEQRLRRAESLVGSTIDPSKHKAGALGERYFSAIRLVRRSWTRHGIRSWYRFTTNCRRCTARKACGPKRKMSSSTPRDSCNSMSAAARPRRMVRPCRTPSPRPRRPRNRRSGIRSTVAAAAAR
jgi:hypothetical protein